MRRVGSKAIRNAAAIVGILAAWQVASWLWFGGETLRSEVPGMARYDLALRQLPNGKGGGPPIHKDFVLSNADERTLGPVVVRELAGAFSNFGLALRTESRLEPPMALTNKGECIGCIGFTYVVQANTPLLATVMTDHFRHGGAALLYSHRRLWLFGTWVRLSDAFWGIT